ncbi:MAG: putative acyltransferase protein [Pseudomonas sp.]|nr:putative acyltransferase protein [Pseudomonas sp.]
MMLSSSPGIARSQYPLPRQRYRSDIDGLRAIAVLLVVLYHARFPISGGFIGVDVFFVISGYLITTLINKEIEEKSFSFRVFYKRRIKRLLPAYFFLLIGLFIYCYQFLLPDDLVSFAKSAAYSMVGVSNIYFFATTGYFGNSIYEPLLHTWSISVEEQFYITWPVALIVISKLKHKKQGVIILFGIFILSFAVSQYLSENHRNVAYFLLLSRFFELMTGCMYSKYQDTLSAFISRPHITSLLGLVLIIGSAVTLDETSPFPGAYALPVCFGTVLVIASGYNTNTGIINKLLSRSLFVYVGKISYSLYLWHWPILILAVYRGVALSALNASLLIGMATVASMISYHLIEAPFRRAEIKKFQTVFVFMYLMPLLLIAGGTYAILKQDGLRLVSDVQVPELDEKNMSHIIRKKCMGTAQVGNILDCHLGVYKDHLDGVLIGDSFANAYAPFIGELAKDAGLMIHDTAMSATPSLPSISVMNMQNKMSSDAAKAIEKYTAARFEFSKKQRIVILSNFWSAYGENKQLRVNNVDVGDITANIIDYHYSAVKSLLDAGVKVVILTQPFGEIGRTAVIELRAKKLRHMDFNRIEYPPARLHSDMVEYKIKAKFPQVTLIDPNDILCKESCSPTLNNTIIFRADGTHLNAIGAAELGVEYIKEKGNPLKGM